MIGSVTVFISIYVKFNGGERTLFFVSTSIISSRSMYIFVMLLLSPNLKDAVFHPERPVHMRRFRPAPSHFITLSMHQKIDMEYFVTIHCIKAISVKNIIYQFLPHTNHTDIYIR